MTTEIRIWIHAVHHPAFRCGGWAYVRSGPGGGSGLAGGDRNTTAQRTELAGLGAALTGLPPAASLILHTDSASLAAQTRLLANPPPDRSPNAPEKDLDLWAPLIAAAKGRAIRLVREEALPHSPAAFAVAWAELARDKAKSGGAFRSAIPKVNLAKLDFA